MTLRSDAIVPGKPLATGLKVFTTLRSGGTSAGTYTSLNLAEHVGDDPRAVQANRARIREALALPAEPLWLEQVHGIRIIDADRSAMAVAPQADGAVTHTRDRVLAIMTADCLPVVLAAADGRALALAHAGWRGLSAGVLGSALDAMGVAPREVAAWIGPGIGAAHYEVDGRVRNAFPWLPDHARAFTPGRDTSHWYCDLPLLAQLALEAAGVRRVEQSGLCTYAEPGRFFSYRRDGETGRMATLAWIGA